MVNNINKNIMTLTITGKVQTVLPEQSGQGKKGVWVKQDFVIVTADQYPKTICFTAWGDLSDIAGNLQEGEEITVSFNPESREYNGKWYTELKAWKIEQNHGMDKKAPKTEKLPKVEFKPETSPFEEENDDLPF
jgi:hypothetical protein